MSHGIEFRWVSDNEAKDCANCERTFSFLFFRFRHHCRRCGRIFCDACSQGRIVIHPDTTNYNSNHSRGQQKSFRVCQECLQLIGVHREIVKNRFIHINGIEVWMAGPIIMLDRIATSLRCQSPSQLENCPVCSQSLGAWSSRRSQRHVEKCCSTGGETSLVHGQRHTVYIFHPSKEIDRNQLLVTNEKSLSKLSEKFADQFSSKTTFSSLSTKEYVTTSGNESSKHSSDHSQEQLNVNMDKKEINVENDSRRDELECPICYVEYMEGDRIALLDCLCRFHETCILEWLGRGHQCPLHPIN